MNHVKLSTCDFVDVVNMTIWQWHWVADEKDVTTV